jgi:hypothetical protein
MGFEMDEDDVSWRDPATDGAGAPVLVPDDRQAPRLTNARFGIRCDMSDPRAARLLVADPAKERTRA